MMLTLTLVSALATGTLWVQDPPRVEELLRALGDDRLPERDRAEAELRKLGVAAEKALRAVPSGGDAEVRTRVARLLAVIDWNRNPPLAFRSNLGHTSLVMLDSRETTARVVLPEAKSGEIFGRPFWASEGSRLVFYAEAGISWVRPGGEDLELLLKHRIEDPWLITCSPDGRFLAFACAESPIPDAKPLQIHLLELATKKLAQISRGKESHSPCWSPDGKRVAFIEYEADNKMSFTMDIVVVDLQGGAVEKVTKDGLNKSVPAWSPEGGRIAYSGNLPDRGIGLVVVDLKTGAARMLAEDSESNVPVWSPDGKRIAYVKGNSPDLYVIDPADGREVPLAKDMRIKGFPTWSPDSKRVAFTGEIDRVSQVYSNGVDGKDLRRHTSEKGGAADPSWAPFR